ncbi:MAG: VacJ family lipoprotein [Methylobacter sp.]|nr:VacJ family lipoprotein [Methylobacter sp.]
MNKPCNGSCWDSKIQRFFSGVLMGAAISLSGCATTGVVEPQAAVNEVDPYENFNRKMFIFNDKVDNYVAEPVSNAYKLITPEFMQTGIYNFFNNLKNINVVINDVLQAKFQQSAQDTGRFAINSTVGLAGVVDVAKHVGLEQNDEDFDQTLAVWGVPHGSYLVLPFLGPSTSRGIPGTVFDTAANPATYVGFLPVQALSAINSRANAEGALKFIDEAALDPYVFTRESFLQWRNNLATDGKAEASPDMDDFEAELDKDVNAPASKKEVTNAVDANKKAGFALRLDAEPKKSGQPPH